MDYYRYIRYLGLLKQLHVSNILTISHDIVKQIPVTIPTVSLVLRFGQENSLGIYLGKILNNYKNIMKYLSSMTNSNMVVRMKIY